MKKEQGLEDRLQKITRCKPRRPLPSKGLRFVKQWEQGSVCLHTRWPDM